MCLLKAAYGWVLFFVSICFCVPLLLEYSVHLHLVIYWCIRISYSHVIFFSGVSLSPLMFYLCVSVYCFCLVVFHTSFLFFYKLCVSVLDSLCVVVICLMKKDFHIYSSPFYFECIWSPSSFAKWNFYSSPFYVLLSQIIPVYSSDLLVIVLLVLWPFILRFR